MAFAYAFEKLNEMGKGSSTPSTTPATSDGSNAANTGNTGNTDNTAYTGNTGNTDNTAYTGNTDNTDNTAYTGNTGSTAYTAYSANNANNGAYPSIPTYSTSTYPTAQTQNGYQRRAVDRDLPADIFEARSISDNNNQNRQTASLDLLGRADLVEAIRLFSRMLDELD
jgi:hypothetical protein